MKREHAREQLRSNDDCNLKVGNDDACLTNESVYDTKVFSDKKHMVKRTFNVNGKVAQLSAISCKMNEETSEHDGICPAGILNRNNES